MADCTVAVAVTAALAEDATKNEVIRKLKT